MAFQKAHSLGSPSCRRSRDLRLVGSPANSIVAERAAQVGVQLSFRDHVKAGVPITLVALPFAELWLWAMGLMRL